MAKITLVGGRRALKSLSEEKPKAAAQLPVPDTATVPREPVPVPPNLSASRPEPFAVPPESASPPPGSSESPLQPWGPLPKTVEEFKKESLEAVRRLTEDYPRGFAFQWHLKLLTFDLTFAIYRFTKGIDYPSKHAFAYIDRGNLPCSFYDIPFADFHGVTK